VTATEAEPGQTVRLAAPAALRGELRVPGDKSVSHRSALLNALADGPASVERYSPGGDCRSTLECLRALGVDWQITAAEPEALSLRLEGRGLAGLSEPDRLLDAGNSGTTTRLLSGILAGQPFLSIVDGDQSLRSRPMLRIVEPLRAIGATILGRRGGNYLPLAISGGRLRGALHRPTVASAQVKSALLLAGLYGDAPTTVVEVAATRDHTERMLRAQGVRVEQDGLAVTVWPPSRLEPVDVLVPGDFSSAAYWLVLACLHPDARLVVRGVGLNPGRTGLLDVLRSMGARITVEQERLEGGEPVGDLVAESSELRAAEIGGDLIPRLIDEVPLLAVAAALASGTTRIRDAAELRVKESDRLATTASELGRLGVTVREQSDGLEIVGQARFQPASVSSHGDHRLAMCLSVAGLAGAGVEVQQADAASVSYPGFWDQAAALGASVER
jgi:3-phosphoshikimate 1-carboxyvinyltransferase